MTAIKLLRMAREHVKEAAEDILDREDRRIIRSLLDDIDVAISAAPGGVTMNSVHETGQHDGNCASLCYPRDKCDCRLSLQSCTKPESEYGATTAIRDMLESIRDPAVDFDPDYDMVVSSHAVIRLRGALADLESRHQVGNNVETYTAADIRAVLAVHWLTEVRCQHEDKTDRSFCWCGSFQSEPQPSVGAAVTRWIEHVMAQLPQHRAAVEFVAGKKS